MESSGNVTELGNASSDEITSKDEPEIAEQVITENAAEPEFEGNWRFYLAFCSLSVVTLAV